MSMENQGTDAALDVAADSTINIAAMRYVQGASVEPTTIRSELDKKIKAIQDGDLTEIVAMLYSQAATLHEVFNQQIKIVTVAKTTEQVQALTQVAFKAQNQCLKALATIADIKKPSHTIFFRQQNNAFNQQVNCSNNELLEKNQGNELLTKGVKDEALDFRGTQEAIGIDSPVEPVGAIDRG